jgi:hypothetical protein
MDRTESSQPAANRFDGAAGAPIRGSDLKNACFLIFGADYITWPAQLGPCPAPSPLQYT